MELSRNENDILNWLAEYGTNEDRSGMIWKLSRRFGYVAPDVREKCVDAFMSGSVK